MTDKKSNQNIIITRDESSIHRMKFYIIRNYQTSKDKMDPKLKYVYNYEIIDSIRNLDKRYYDSLITGFNDKINFRQDDFFNKCIFRPQFLLMPNDTVCYIVSTTTCQKMQFVNLITNDMVTKEVTTGNYIETLIEKILSQKKQMEFNSNKNKLDTLK
ncbi:MAG: hypothetical protein WCH34_02800 [Bacteroidota bacterium]